MTWSAAEVLAHAALAQAHLDALGSALEHGAAPREEHAGLHRHAGRGDVTLDLGAGPHLERAQSTDVPNHPTLDERLADLDVGAHQPVLGDLNPVAVEDVALELAL